MKIEESIPVSAEMEQEIRMKLLGLWSVYLTGLVFHHVSEFVLGKRRGEIITLKSSVLGSNRLYLSSVVLAFLEFWMEFFFYPQWKYSKAQLCIIGLFCIVGGLTLKTMAIVQAGRNYAPFKNPPATHQLVKTGIYSSLRHPAYCGFFWFSVGNQMLLLNPVTFLLVSVLTWKHFYTLIPAEEEMLKLRYPQEYPQYRRVTGIGIPYTMYYKMEVYNAIVRR